MPIAEPHIKRLRKKDILLFEELIKFFSEIFELKGSAAEKKYLIKLLSSHAFIVYAAIIEDEIIGGLTAYELPMYHANASEIFIYDIAVKPTFQRYGVGRKLLLAIENYCKKNGIKIIFVAANEEDNHALDFYHATGGQPEKVMHFNYYVK